MSERADDPFIESGRLLFARECGFIWAASKPDGLPPMGAPEVAFAGRSNVGKSSLVNALTNRKTLARTSSTPGRTQQLNFFDLGEDLRIVDLPGYGYAAVGREKVANWTSLTHGFLRGRATLARVYVLVDARHGLKDLDTAMFDTLDKAAVSYQVVLTKADAVSAAEGAAQVERTVAALARRPAAFPQVALTSSSTGEGIPDLRAAIARVLAERDAMAGTSRIEVGPAAR